MFLLVHFRICDAFVTIIKWNHAYKTHRSMFSDSRKKWHQKEMAPPLYSRTLFLSQKKIWNIEFPSNRAHNCRKYLHIFFSQKLTLTSCIHAPDRLEIYSDKFLHEFQSNDNIGKYSKWRSRPTCIRSKYIFVGFLRICTIRSNCNCMDLFRWVTKQTVEWKKNRISVS